MIKTDWRWTPTRMVVQRHIWWVFLPNRRRPKSPQVVLQMKVKVKKPPWCVFNLLDLSSEGSEAAGLCGDLRPVSHQPAGTSAVWSAVFTQQLKEGTDQRGRTDGERHTTLQKPRTPAKRKLIGQEVPSLGLQFQFPVTAAVCVWWSKLPPYSRSIPPTPVVSTSTQRRNIADQFGAVVGEPRSSGSTA